MNNITYLHPFKAGDLISTLPGIKHLFETTGRKALIYQRLGMPMYFDERKEQCMGLKMFEFLKPLILAQDYISGFESWEGESVEIDLTLSRDSQVVGLPFGSIHHWGWALVPEMQCNLFVPWIHPEPDHDFSDRVIVNLTSRYRNSYISYFFLKKYRDRILFTGTDDEYDSFRSENKIDVGRTSAPTAKELARIIAGSRLFLGNQSFLWHISDAMKSPRLLEASPAYANTFPTGNDGYFFLHQKALEMLFEKLIQ